MTHSTCRWPVQLCSLAFESMQRKRLFQHRFFDFTALKTIILLHMFILSSHSFLHYSHCIEGCLSARFLNSNSTFQCNTTGSANFHTCPSDAVSKAWLCELQLLTQFGVPHVASNRSLLSITSHRHWTLK